MTCLSKAALSAQGRKIKNKRVRHDKYSSCQVLNVHSQKIVNMQILLTRQTLNFQATERTAKNY
jgi:hypothetical protein